ncbi:MAG: PAS domain S-box protein [Candidatus Hydrogenedentota bacterium]
MTRKSKDLVNEHLQVSMDSQFDALVLQHPDGLVILDEQGVVLFANEAAGKLLGHEGNGLPLGSTLDLPLELAESGNETIVTHTKPTISLDYRLKPVQWDGRRAYLLCVRDVTQDLRKLRHLEKLERRGRLIVSQAAEGIVVIQDGVLKFHNPMVKKVTGYSDNRLRQMPVTDLIHKEDISVIDNFQSVLSAKPESPATYVMRVLTKDGETLWVEVKATRIEWQSRPAALCFFTDITNRVYAEQDRMLLATAVEQAVEAIVVTDAHGRVEYVNSAFEDLTGYTREEVLGRSPQVLYGGEAHQEAYEQMWAAINRGEIWNGRFQNQKKDGTVYEEDTTVSPVFDENRHLTNFVILKRDVTAQVNLERALRNAQRMEAMGTLAGGIAHDFNNSLALILGRCELGLNALPKDHPAAQQFASIYKAGQRAAGIVKQILVFCRQAEHEKKPLIIGLVVKEAVELLRSALPKNIEIQADIDKTGSRVLSDPSQVHQVVMNLCTNACHAMGEHGGVLSVSLKDATMDGHWYVDAGEIHSGPYVHLAVGDTGMGMDHATIQRIFDPFFTTKEPDEGTGLGLATVHGIVTGSGGAIQVDSAPGKGATFNLYFPQCKEKEVCEEPVPRDILAGTERILVVDDDADFLEMYQALLSQHGYQVTSFGRGADALEYFRVHPDDFDVIITDHIMPGMSGVELAKKLLEIRPQVPILLSSGLGKQNAQTPVLEEGIKERLFKPTPLAELVAAIRRAVAKT